MVGRFNQLGAWRFGFYDRHLTLTAGVKDTNKEDFDFEEFEAAIELYKEHEEEEK